ncbi:MAG: FAD-dependent thymidylate synthase [archaeon]|nr:FAD-dependent thymidylate synthase [archaeon]
MNLVNQNVVPIVQENTVDGMYKHIELCGRTCYKSEDKITETSAKEFVDRMINSNHTAMLEHGTVYLSIPKPIVDSQCYKDLKVLKHNNYTRWCSKRGIFYITTNYRVLVENDLTRLINYIVEPTYYHKKRYTFKFTICRQVSHEAVRHRHFSFAQESTRFCNYNKSKFGGSITFVKPNWLSADELSEFQDDLNVIEAIYFKWIERGWTAQQAAYFLPNGTKCDFIMTGFMSDWRHFIDLRSKGITGAPHPLMKEVADKVFEYFKSNSNKHEKKEK